MSGGNLVAGYVQEVIQRGKATNIKLDDGKLYGCGFDGVPCEEGDYVSFQTYQNGKFTNARVDTMEVDKNAKPAPKQQQPQAQGSTGQSKDDYWRRREEEDKAKQHVIEWQAARNSAIHVVDIAAREGALPLPQKKDEKFDAIKDVVTDLTRQYFEEARGLREGNIPGQAPVPVQEATSYGGFEE